MKSKDLLCFDTGSAMPAPLQAMIPGSMGASMDSFARGEVSAFMYLDDPSCKEIEAFGEPFVLSLFICENIPFFIFLFRGFHLEAAVSDKAILEETDTLLMRIVDTRTKIIVAQRSIRAPKNMIRIAYNALDSGLPGQKEPEKTIERIRNIWTIEQMVENGIALKLGVPNE